MSAATLASTELRRRLASLAPPTVLDVRTPAELETAHIAGSHNVPLDVLRVRLDDVVVAGTIVLASVLGSVAVPTLTCLACNRGSRDDETRFVAQPGA